MIYLFTVSTSLIVHLILLRFSPYLNIVDKPNNRSSHIHAVPRTGGMAFGGSFLLTLLLFYPDVQSISVWAAMGSVFLLGVYDDVRPLRANQKLFFILLGGVVLYLNGITIDSLGTFFNWDLSLGWMAFPFTLLVVGGLTNAINLIDGLDSLASGVSMVILLAFAYIGYKFEDATILILSTTLMASLLPFLFFNYHPARIFMGDSGSLTLGFIIAILTVLSIRYIHPVSILYLCAVPLIDTLVIILRRIKMKKSPFSADKNHIHHILKRSFKSEKTTSFFIILLQILFCYIGYVVARQIEVYPHGLLPLATVGSFMILILLNYIVFTTLLKNQLHGNPASQE